MFCGKCGAKNPDENRFCANCGATLQRIVPTGVSNGPVQTVSSGAGSETSKEREERLEERVQSTIKDLIKAPLFLVAAICYSLVQLFGLLDIQDGGVMSTVYDALDQMGVDSYMVSGLFSGLEDAISSVTLLTMLPGIAITIGLWLLFVSASGGPYSKLQPAGLTVIRWIQILNEVVIGLALGFGLYSILTAYGQLGDSSYYDSIRDVLGGALGVLLVVAAIVITYYTVLVNTIAKIERTIQTSIPDSGVSAGLAVLQIISGALSVLGAISSGMSFSVLLQATATIMFGAMLFQYRNAMQRLEGEQYRERMSNFYSSADHPSSGQPQDKLPTWKMVEIQKEHRLE